MKQFNGNNNLWNDNIENQWEACWNHRNEFIEFINKIHPNPITPAFKTMPNELDDGHPMEYAIQYALMRTSS